MSSLTRKFKAPSVPGPKVLVQTWLTADEYAAVEKACLEKQWSLAHFTRESVKKHAEEIAA